MYLSKRAFFGGEILNLPLLLVFHDRLELHVLVQFVQIPFIFYLLADLVVQVALRAHLEVVVAAFKASVNFALFGNLAAVNALLWASEVVNLVANWRNCGGVPSASHFRNSVFLLSHKVLGELFSFRTGRLLEAVQAFAFQLLSKRIAVLSEPRVNHLYSYELWIITGR